MAADRVEAFANRANRLALSAVRLEGLRSAGSLTKRDVELAYEGLFLSAITALESHFEALFFAAILGKSGHSKRRVTPRVSFASELLVREVVFAGEDYLDWLPYGHTESRARRFLRGGRPFTELDDGHRSNLAGWIRTRNVIAHRSAFAKAQFEAKVLSGLTLPPGERTPAGYLRAQIRVAPTVSRFEAILVQMADLVRVLG